MDKILRIYLYVFVPIKMIGKNILVADSIVFLQVLYQNYTIQSIW